MTNNKIILIGPMPSSDALQNPGGQLTAAGGIIDYASENAYQLDVVDTLIKSFPPPSFIVKLNNGLRRVVLTTKKLFREEINGIIIFAGARHSFFERILIAAIAKIFSVKSLFCIRDGHFQGWIESSYLINKLVRVLLKIPDVFICQGSDSRNVLLTAGVPEEKTIIVHNWMPRAFDIATQVKSPQISKGLNLVFVGWLVRDKGIWELINAVSKLSLRYDITLNIAGGGTLDKSLREYVKEKELVNVHFHGWLDHAEVTNLLDKSDVFVLPTYVEGFPNALLEAMARGLPAICSGVGAIPDSIKENINGMLIPSRNTKALVSAIEKYVLDRNLIEQHSIASLKQVKDVHDFDKNLNKLFSNFN